MHTHTQTHTIHTTHIHAYLTYNYGYAARFSYKDTSKLRTPAYTGHYNNACNGGHITIWDNSNCPNSGFNIGAHPITATSSTK